MSRRKPRPWWARVLDWVAIFVAIESFVFLIAWQMYPAWDDTEILPTFYRTLLISGPLTLSMWGVAYATKPGSDVPRYMSERIPYAQLNPDGTTGSTTYADQHPKKGTTSENDQ